MKDRIISHNFHNNSAFLKSVFSMKWRTFITLSNSLSNYFIQNKYSQEPLKLHLDNFHREIFCQ